MSERMPEGTAPLRNPPTAPSHGLPSLFNSPRKKMVFGKRKKPAQDPNKPAGETPFTRKRPSPKALTYQASSPSPVPVKRSLDMNGTSKAIGTAIPNTQAGFSCLTRELVSYIVDFLDGDVPSLGAVACVSKTLQNLAYEDKRWKGPLLDLQIQLFDKNIRIQGHPSTQLPPVKPLYLRTQEGTIESTQFLKWIDEQEGRSNLAKQHDRNYREFSPIVVAVQHCGRFFRPDQDPWLYQNVGYRDYYRQLGGLGLWAEVVCQTYCFQHSQCYACFRLLSFGPNAPGMYCVGCGTKTLDLTRDHLREQVLGKLPSIRLFRTMPEWSKDVHKECLRTQNSGDQEFADWVRENYERFLG